MKPASGVIDGLMVAMNFLTRVLLIFSLFATGMVGVASGFYTFMPMRWWVDYKAVHVVETPPPNPEMVEVTRTVPTSFMGFPYRNTIIPVTRFVELHEILPNGLRQHCPSVSWTTAEAATNPSVVMFLADFVGRDCNLTALEGKRLNLQVTYDIELPYGIHKQKSFYDGPFVATEGNLLQPLAQSDPVEYRPSVPLRSSPQP